MARYHYPALFGSIFAPKKKAAPKMTKAQALALGESWTDAGWSVLFYPSGLTSKSRNVRMPVLVAERAGWQRQAFKTGPVRVTDPEGNGSWVELAAIAGGAQ